MWMGFIKVLFAYSEALKMHSEAVLQDKHFDHDMEELLG